MSSKEDIIELLSTKVVTKIAGQPNDRDLIQLETELTLRMGGEPPLPVRIGAEHSLTLNGW